MGGVPLNQPVTAMVSYGDGYLMVAADGGVFVFSWQPFGRSLADHGLPAPLVSVAARCSADPARHDAASQLVVREGDLNPHTLTGTGT